MAEAGATLPPLPDQKEKGWEFTDLTELDLDAYEPAAAVASIEAPDGATVLRLAEAVVGKISDEQLFYLRSRGLSEEEAAAMIVNGFIEPVTKELPMEYAVELNRLIQLEMIGSIG